MRQSLADRIENLEALHLYHVETGQDALAERDYKTLTSLRRDMARDEDRRRAARRASKFMHLEAQV